MLIAERPIMTDDMLTLDQAVEEFGLKRATLYRHKIRTYQKVGDRRSYVKRKDMEALTRFKPRKKWAKARHG